MRETSWLLNYNPSYITSEVMLKNYLRQNCLFLRFMTPGGQTIELRSNLAAHSGRAVNGLSFAFFRAALALLVHELERLKLRIVEMVENREHFEFDEIW